MASKAAQRPPAVDAGPPVRVAMVIQQFHPIVGGAERQARRLGAALVRQGIPVTLYTARWSATSLRQEFVDGIDVRRLGVVRFGTNERRGAGISFMVRLFVELVRRSRTYDVLHIHQALKPAVAAVAASLIVRKPTIIKVGCGGDWNDIGLLRNLRLGPVPIGTWMVAVLRRCTRIVALNGSIARDLMTEGFAAGQIREIPNGVTLSAARPVTRARRTGIRLLFVGRLDHQKGLDLLLEALRRVPKSNAWTLTVVGVGEDGRAYEAVAGTMGLADSVRFLGLVDNVPELMGASDVFVLPSRAEGMSNALLEAMSAGMACVATSIGGNTELITDGATGVLVPADDAVALSRALRRVMDSPALRRRLGNAARRRVEESYAIDAVAQQYRKEYRTMVAGGSMNQQRNTA